MKKTELKTYFHKSKKDNLFRDIFWRGIQMGGREGISFFMFIIVSAILTPSDVSLYSYVLSIAYLVVKFGDFGISNATSRFVAENDGDEESDRKLVGNILLILIFLSLLASFFVFILGDKFFPAGERLIVYILPMLLLSPIFSLYDGVLRGQKKFETVAKRVMIAGVASLAISYFLTKEMGVIGALIGQNVHYLFLSVFLSATFGRPILKFDKKVLIKVLGYSLILGLSNIGLYLYTRADVIIMGSNGYLEEVAYYELAYKLFTLAMLPSTIIGSVFAPRITRLFAKKEFTIIKKTIKYQILGLLACGVLCSVLIWFLLPFIVDIVFPQYEISLVEEFMKIFLILLPLRYFSSFLTEGYINASGNAKITTVTLIIFGLINVSLDYIFVRSFGYIGIMYATLLSQIGFIAIKDGYFLFKIIKKLK